MAPWQQRIPAVPLGLPSELLQRRPDVAANERAVAAANAQIGIERAAYFPSLTLSASGGPGGSRFGQLFSASGLIWSIGASLTETVFDGGLRNARVSAAEAARDVATARYRQNVLTAFQAVEDQLAATRSLAEQNTLRKQSSDAADQSEQQILNRYRPARSATPTSSRRRLRPSRRAARWSRTPSTARISAINLIQALGGGWRDSGPVEVDRTVQAEAAASSATR